MKYVIALAALASASAFGADPFSSVYKQTLKGSAFYVTSTEGSLKFFEFGDIDSLFGSIAIESNGTNQEFKFNAINYYLWLGGEHHIPFQVYFADDTGNYSDTGDIEKSNEGKMLDPESGIAIKFPVLWIYQAKKNTKQYCAFLSDEPSIGHCAIGGDITFNVKQLTTLEGKSDTASGLTVRVGASSLFPVLSQDKSRAEGYLALSYKFIFARTNTDDSTQLFSPINDANGNVIKFDESILANELKLKWAMSDIFSIEATWVKPLDNKDYFDDLFTLSFTTQFQPTAPKAGFTQ